MKIEELQALDAFGALSQETRLRMVRALVEAGPEGMSAGAVGDAVEASSSAPRSISRISSGPAL